MEANPIALPDAAASAAGAQARADSNPPPPAAGLADNAAVNSGQAVTAVSQGTRRLVDIFA
jgi:hypothetical protein